MFIKYPLIIVMYFLSLLFTNLFAENIILKNNNWIIEINPETLQTKAILPSKSEVYISSPLKIFKVSNQKVFNNQATWVIDSNSKVKATLVNNKLTFSFSSSISQNIAWPVVLKQGYGIIIPIKEGYYIKSDDELWKNALKNEYSGINTTEDLSLPVIGLDLGDTILNILFISPFNNKINFFENDNTIFSTNHEFSTLDKEKDYEVQIILSDNKDLLAPAKEYRKWLIENNKFISLEEKIAKTKEGKKIIGASHVYLWGERLITQTDIKDWNLLQKLIPRDWFTGDSWINVEAKKALQEKNLNKKPYMQTALLNAIEEYLVNKVSGYDFEQIEQRKNIIAKILGKALNQQDTWGDINSPKMIELFNEEGLKNLWIGYPQWTAGFSSPKGVEKALELGYLISPYDSYDTALPKENSNKSWLTAQMGENIFKNCGIILKNGKKKSGFQNEGVYTNTKCIQATLEKRVNYLLSINPYNSWFLDVDATGMVFDDYNPKNLTTQKQDAQNRIETMNLITKKGLILGSEVGGSVVNSPIIFAHGMQTSGFGWTDQDMRKNTKSPYFLGIWYPNHQPEHFFRASIVKPEYKHLYFNPKNRLPLFQAVFHDSVITTHHWTIDSLKFRDVRPVTELLQMLYNVPPLLNISLQTSSKRLKYLKKLDEFFNPLHKQLYNQSLINFKWLDKEGMVQQTTFANGIKIIANFNEKPVKINNINLPAKGVIALLTDGSTRQFISPELEISKEYYSN